MVQQVLFTGCHKCTPCCIPPAFPTDPGPTVAELQPAAAGPGAAAGAGAGAGSHPPRGCAGERDRGEWDRGKRDRGKWDRGAAAAGGGCAAQLGTQWRPGDGHAPPPLHLLPAHAPALPVPREWLWERFKKRGEGGRNGKSAVHLLCCVHTCVMLSSGCLAMGVWMQAGPISTAEIICRVRCTLPSLVTIFWLYSCRSLLVLGSLVCVVLRCWTCHTSQGVCRQFER